MKGRRGALLGVVEMGAGRVWLRRRRRRRGRGSLGGLNVRVFFCFVFFFVRGEGSAYLVVG